MTDLAAAIPGDLVARKATHDTVRIGYVTGEYPKVSHTFIQREVAALRKIGAQVTTFTIRTPDPKSVVGDEQEAEAQSTIKVLDIARNPIFLIFAHCRVLLNSPMGWLSGVRWAWRLRSPGLQSLLYQFFYFLEAGVVAYFLKAKEIDIVHNHFADSSGTVALLASRMARIDFSMTVHGPTIFFAPEKWRLRDKIEAAKFVSCISWFCRSQCMQFSSWDTWPKLKIVHCGVQPQHYSPEAKRQAGKVLVFVGRLAAAKGLPVLIDALPHIIERHPETKLVLVGDSPERLALETLVRERNLDSSIEFTGYQDQKAVSVILSRSDVFVLPSFSEGVPVVLMEAMASQLPVVASNIAGISELVEDGTSGYLVPPGDAHSLASKICMLLDDVSLRQRMGMRGRDMVQSQFNIEIEAQRLFNLFNGLEISEVPPSL